MLSPLFADISDNNVQPDFAAYRKAGHIIVGIKASESEGYINPDHKAWTHEAHAHKIAVIHYHFADARYGTVPQRECSHFLTATRGLIAHRDYVALDYEEPIRNFNTMDLTWIAHYASYMRANSPYRPWLYASRSALQSLARHGQLPIRRVWDADWSAGPDYTPPGCVVVARQRNNGITGPPPLALPGIGHCDVNRLSRAMFVRVAARVATWR